jgi:hypothetical protein
LPRGDQAFRRQNRILLQIRRAQQAGRRGYTRTLPCSAGTITASLPSARRWPFRKRFASSASVRTAGKLDSSASTGASSDSGAACACSVFQRDHARPRQRPDLVRRSAFRWAPQPSAAPMSSPSTRT